MGCLRSGGCARGGCAVCGARATDVLLGVIARAHQWAGGDVLEAEPVGRSLECRELVRVPVAHDRQVALRRTQVLPDGEHPHAVLAQCSERIHHLLVGLTVGQYLRPSERHLPVVRYWHPDEFAALERDAYALGFDHVAAGPLVRSSYHADLHVPQPQPGDGPLAARG